MSGSELIYFGFLNSVKNFPNRPSIEVSGNRLTYLELFKKASSLAATINYYKDSLQAPHTAIFAYRSIVAFAGILGILMAGHAYVPLNPKFPIERTKKMLQLSGARIIIADNQAKNQIDQLLSDLEYEMIVILPDSEDIKDLRKKWSTHKFIGRNQVIDWDQWSENVVSPDFPAYIMFTSGSTGVPKGVVVTHRNVMHYINFITERFSITKEDRFSQMFDLTFDLSVSDMFVAWNCGACLCCPSEKMLFNPSSFINSSGITIWFSVPSTAIFMKRLGTLKPNTFPNLRVSLFCGEALPIEVIKAWSEAAPNSIIENLYGPTELTIACMFYRWNPYHSLKESEMGIVPIGYPFPDMISKVVDENLQEVNPGETGELLMAGPQVSAGYLNDPDRTNASFIFIQNKIYYRTGDIVRRPIEGGPMTYLGRVDSQIKILGHRVELGEIEHIIRKVTGIDEVVAIGWPITPSGANGIEVFLRKSSAIKSDFKERVVKSLPSYMVPKNYHFLEELPLNPNGKYDRKKLIKYLEGSL